MSQSRQLELCDLKEDDWNEIRRIALGLHKSGSFDQSQFKCSIAAFIQWIAMQPEEVSIMVGEIEAPEGQVH